MISLMCCLLTVGQIQLYCIFFPIIHTGTFFCWTCLNLFTLKEAPLLNLPFPCSSTKYHVHATVKFGFGYIWTLHAWLIRDSASPVIDDSRSLFVSHCRLIAPVTCQMPSWCMPCWFLEAFLFADQTDFWRLYFKFLEAGLIWKRPHLMCKANVFRLLLCNILARWHNLTWFMAHK